MRKAALWALVALAAALLLWSMWPSSTDSAATAAAGGREDRGLAGDKSAAAAAGGQSAGARTAPLLAPGEGETFEIAGPAGSRVRGRRWPGATATAPLLLLAPGSADQAQGWQPLVELLRAVRDYHLVAWDDPLESVRPPAVVTDLHGATLRAVLAHARREMFPRSAAAGVIGLGAGATSALLLTGERADIKAVVAIAPRAEVDGRQLGEVLDVLGRRQVMAVGSEADTGSAQALAALGRLPHARIVRPPGARAGLDLLAHDRRLMTNINGWLFAAMGPQP